MILHTCGNSPTRKAFWPVHAHGPCTVGTPANSGTQCCRERVWSAVPGQGPGRVLILPLCCGRNKTFLGEILQMSNWFGTEGSVVQIHSPRPILQNSSRICRVQSGSSLGFSAHIGSREPSAPYFKRRPSKELFDIRL